MSYGGTVHCARQDDLGCTASHPGDKFSAIRAGEAGWFRSRQTDEEFCPEHVPGWVPAWRERQKRARRKVRTTFEKRPASVACSGCQHFSESLEIPDDDRKAAEVLKSLRVRVHDHAYRTGHVVTVTTVQVMTFEPYDEEAVRRPPDAVILTPDTRRS